MGAAEGEVPEGARAELERLNAPTAAWRRSVRNGPLAGLVVLALVAAGFVAITWLVWRGNAEQGTVSLWTERVLLVLLDAVLCLATLGVAAMLPDARRLASRGVVLAGRVTSVTIDPATKAKPGLAIRYVARTPGGHAIEDGRRYEPVPPWAEARAQPGWWVAVAADPDDHANHRALEPLPVE